MKNLLTLVITISIISLFANQSFANHEGHSHDGDDAAPAKFVPNPAECKDAVNVKVNGLVCDFCARALEKVFSKQGEVSGIDVDLDKGNVLVQMKNGQTINDEALTKLITDSGYNVVGINRGC